MRAYMGKRKRGTQAVRMLALLTESGFAYCALWVRLSSILRSRFPVFRSHPTRLPYS